MSLAEVKAKVTSINKKVQLISELDLSNLKIGKFTPEIKAYLEKCKNVEVASMTDCGLESLENFPKWNLKAIDLSSNKLKDDSIAIFADFKDLTQILYVQNKVENVESFKALSGLNNLTEVDFSDNPVADKPDYRSFLFDQIKSLDVIDRKDKDGNELAEQGSFDQDQDEDDDEQQFQGDDDEDDEEYSEESQKPKKKRK